jgi:hypothetical protein
MNYVVEMTSGGMMYVPSFINIGSGIQKLLRGHPYTETQAHAQTKVSP